MTILKSVALCAINNCVCPRDDQSLTTPKNESHVRANVSVLAALLRQAFYVILLVNITGMLVLLKEIDKDQALLVVEALLGCSKQVHGFDEVRFTLK